MDNDILINQARQLYVVLLVELFGLTAESKTRSIGLENLAIGAYCRYQRRLNHCVVCYQYRSFECIRVAGKKLTPCITQNWRTKKSSELQTKINYDQSRC